MREGGAKPYARWRPASMRVLLVGDVCTGVAHREHADQQADRGDQRRADPDDGAGGVLAASAPVAKAVAATPR